MANASLAPTRAHSYPVRITNWLFSTIGNWRTLMGGLIAVGLTVVSIKFNLELAKAMSVDQDSKNLLMAGFGMLDLACVFLAGFIGIRSRSPFRKLVAWLLFAYLLCLSLWASVAYALAIDARKANTANNHAIELKQSEVTTQQRNVELWQSNLAQTTRFKTRYSGLLNQEQTKLSTLQAELSALESSLPAPTMAIYNRVAPHAGMTPDNLALLVRILWSVALVLSPIVLLPLLAVELVNSPTPQNVPDDKPRGGKRTRKGFTNWFHKAKGTFKAVPNEIQSPSPVSATSVPNEVHVPDTEKRTRKPRKPTTKGLQHDTGTKGKAGNRYDDLKKNVLSGRVRPSVRAIRDFCGCNQTVANRYIQALANDGLIEQGSNGRWQVRNLRVVK